MAKTGSVIKVISYDDRGSDITGAMITGSCESIKIAKGMIMDVIEKEKHQNKSTTKRYKSDKEDENPPKKRK
jgi:hypothetical protein